jgi:hypothetical protein
LRLPEGEEEEEEEEGAGEEVAETEKVPEVSTGLRCWK